MGNKNTIAIELTVTDKGSVVVKQFASSASKGMQEAEDSTRSLSQSMTGLESAARKVASIIAGYKMAEFIKDSALAGARYETLGVVMTVVGNNAGYSRERMEALSKQLQETGISMLESRQSVTKMVQAHLDLSRATELARVAQDAAVIGNINSSESFDRLIFGIQSGQTEVLRTIGINVNFEESYKRLAKETGRTTESLSEAEKATARMNSVLDRGKDIAGTYESAMGTAGKKLTSFKRYVEDFEVQMGTAFGPATVMMVDAATETMKKMQTEIQRPESQEALRALSVEIAKVVQGVGEELPGAIRKTTTALSGLTSIYNSLPGEVVGAAGAGIIGRLLFGSWGPAKIAAVIYLINESLGRFNMNLGSIPQKMASGSGAIQNIMDVLAGRKDWNTGALTGGSFNPQSLAAKQLEGMAMPSIGPSLANLAVMQEEKLRWAQANPSTVKPLFEAEKAMTPNQLRDLWIKAEAEKYAATDEFNTKYLADAKKLKEEDEKFQQENLIFFQFTTDEEIDAIQGVEDKEKKSAAERLKAERDLYTDLRGYERNYYDASIALMNSQVAEFRKQGVSEIAIKAWVAEETAKLEIKKAKASDSFFDGVAAGWREISREQTTWGKAGADTVAAFSADATKQLSANFFNILKGNFDQLSIDWTSLWDSMLQVLADRMAKMATEAMVDQGIKVAGSALGWMSDLLGSSGAADTIWDLWAGYAEGAWMVKGDKWTKVHDKEMIIPAAQAEQIRQGSGPGPGEAWDAGFPIGEELTDQQQSALDAAAVSFRDSYLIGIFGKELAALALAGKAVAPVLAIPATFFGLIRAGMAYNKEFNAYGARTALTTQMMDYSPGTYSIGRSIGYTGFQVDPELAAYAASLSADGSVSGGGSYAETAAQADADAGAAGMGWKYGGISVGPDSGYPARLHGVEAHVPLPMNRKIPVEITGGNDGRQIVITGPLISIGGNLIADDKAFKGFAKDLAREIDAINSRRIDVRRN